MHVADWYATLSIIAGAGHHDKAHVGGAVHDIDGVDMWPAIVGTNTTNPRATLGEDGEPAWVPTTNWSILAQFSNGTIVKLITQ
eukprot:gene35896-6406_t